MTPKSHMIPSNSFPPGHPCTTSEQLAANPVDERRGISAQRQAAARSLAEKVASGSKRERQAQARRAVQAADALRAATAVASQAALVAAAVVTQVQVRAPLSPSITHYPSAGACHTDPLCYPCTVACLPILQGPSATSLCMYPHDTSRVSIVLEPRYVHSRSPSVLCTPPLPGPGGTGHCTATSRWGSGCIGRRCQRGVGA